MGNTKRWVMESEDAYWDYASQIIGECETLDEFQHRMESRRRLIAWYPAEDVALMLNDAWHEKWSKYR